MKLIFSIILLLSLSACAGRSAADADNGNDSSQLKNTLRVVKFDADSAFAYVSRQVAFGPRVPGTPGHTKCANYIVAELKRHGVDTVLTQNALVSAYTGDILPITNILGRVNSAARRRVLVIAHYDTRPWADNESSEADRKKPIPGANDGASGVGVMLEMARLFGHRVPEIGVDLLFIDAEDYGKTEGWGNNDETWCLGTQHWIKNMPYAKGELPEYGIVLDMVGGIGAVFHREYLSNKVAPAIVDKVWSVAANSEFANRFVNELGGAIVDDHVFINRAGIPCIDIVECNNSETRSFPPTWHKLNDDMSNIDPMSLHAVGQVVTDVIYNEKNPL